jgi:hypothetical protein
MLQYRLWKDGGLWHWEVMTRHGVRVHHGACDDLVKSRTEALSVATRPATAATVEVLEHDVDMEACQRAFRNAREQSEQLFQDSLAFTRSCALSTALISKSKAAISESRQMIGVLSLIL